MNQSTDEKCAKPAMTTIAGIAASRGHVAGPVFVYRPNPVISIPEYEIAPDRVLAELARYHEARATTRTQIEALMSQLEKDNRTGADIFANHLAMIDDPTMTSFVERRVREERVNVETAIRRTTAEFRSAFGRMTDPYLRERVRDLDDVERRLLRVLLGLHENVFAQISEPVVVVATDIAPSETMAIPRGMVLGFAIDHGSATSHVALLARALGVPAVVGLGDVVDRVHSGSEILLDGSTGEVTLNPDVKTCAEFARLTRRERELRALIDGEHGRSGATKDGFPVRFCANAQPGVPMSGIAESGAEGVGLYRTEYFWLSREGIPSEDAQAEDYSAAARSAAEMGPNARVVFRALDIGGDKLMSGQAACEPNPFLGNRSIRWLLANREVFRCQLRAILRASAVGPSAILWPMVATLDELRGARSELTAAMAELRAAGIPFDEHLPVGCMIEVPAAALCAEQFAREVDFFSIGTNDLVQYTMAADRGNARVAHLYQPTNPAVLRLIEIVIQAAQRRNLPVAVCGATAGDPVLGALWVGMGVSELSMSASYIPVLRKVIGALTMDDLRELAKLAHDLCDGHSAAEIYSACRDYILSKVPRLEEIQTLFTSA